MPGRKTKKAFPKTVLLFVTPPTAGELKHRLTCRGTETEEVIDSRLRRAVEEADGMGQYDYLIINDDLERCAKELHDIVQGEHRKSFRNTEFMEKIKQDLQRLKGE